MVPTGEINTKSMHVAYLQIRILAYGTIVNDQFSSKCSMECIPGRWEVVVDNCSALNNCRRIFTSYDESILFNGRRKCAASAMLDLMKIRLKSCSKKILTSRLPISTTRTPSTSVLPESVSVTDYKTNAKMMF